MREFVLYSIRHAVGVVVDSFVESPGAGVVDWFTSLVDDVFFLTPYGSSFSGNRGMSFFRTSVVIVKM